MKPLRFDVKELRRALGYTQEQLADALGVHRITVINWENQSASPSPLALGHLRDLRHKHEHNKSTTSNSNTPSKPLSVVSRGLFPSSS